MNLKNAREKPKNSIEKEPPKARSRARSISAAARVRTREGSVDARKKPRQERSRHMVEAILQAAAELFAERGYAGTTTNKIAERAGVSVGSLYQYFPNKDSVLSELWAQHRAAVHPIIDSGLNRLADPRVPIGEGIRSLLVDLLDAHRRSPAVTRALSAGVIRESPVAAEHEKDEEGELLLDRICAILLERTDTRKGDHPAMAAVLTHVTSQITRWLAHDPPPGISPDALLEESIQLLTRFLSK